MNEESSPILQLRPVTFTYKTDALNTKQYGLIAKEVNDVMPELVLYKDDQIETVKYHELVPLLLNEVIKQDTMIKDLKEHYNKELSSLMDCLLVLESKN